MKPRNHLNRHSMRNAWAIMRSDGYTLTPFYKQVCEMLVKIPGHKLVVPDSAYDFVRFTGGSKIDEDAVNEYVKVILEGFCRDTDSTLWVPWHPSRAGQERGDGSGWSVAWEAGYGVRALAVGGYAMDRAP